MYVTLTA